MHVETVASRSIWVAQLVLALLVACSCGARTGLDVPELEPGEDNAYVCTCTCNWAPALGDRPITTSAQVCLPPELNLNRPEGRAPTHEDLVEDCNDEVSTFAFASYVAGTTVWTEAGIVRAGIGCTCDVGLAPGSARETFWGGPACDRDCERVEIPFYINERCPAFDLPDLKAGTVFEGEDEDRAVCRVPRSDPPVLLPEPPGASFMAPASSGVVTRGEARIVLDDNEYTTQTHGELLLPGVSCPEQSCAVGMAFSIYADPIGVGDFLGLRSVTLEDITFGGAGTPSGLVLDPEGRGSYSAGTVQAWGRGSAVERELGEERSRSTAAFFLTSAAPVLVQVDWASSTFSLDGEFELPAGDDPATDPSVLVSVHVEGVLTNQPPTPRIAPTAAIVECTSPRGAELVLDGRESLDMDGNLLFHTWSRASGIGDRGLAMAPVVNVLQATGTTETYSLLVGDTSGNYVEASTTVTVEDTTAPEITLETLEPSCIWSSRHKYVRFILGEQIEATADDACDAAPVMRIARVFSSEDPDAVGDGSTAIDVLAGETGFCVRAERSGPSMDGRTYTAVLEAVDCTGNRSESQVVIRVPHDAEPNCVLDADSFISDREAEEQCVFADVAPSECVSEPPSVLATVGGLPPRAEQPRGGCRVVSGSPRSSLWVLLLGLAASSRLLGRRRDPR